VGARAEVLDELLFEMLALHTRKRITFRPPSPCLVSKVFVRLVHSCACPQHQTVDIWSAPTSKGNPGLSAVDNAPKTQHHALDRARASSSGAARGRGQGASQSPRRARR